MIARALTAIAMCAVLAIAPVIAAAQASSSPFTHGTRYDAAGRMVGTIAPDPDGSGPLAFAATRSTYNDRGELVAVESGVLSSWQADTILPSAWVGFTVFNRVDTSYDAMGRKVKEVTSTGTSGPPYAVTQYSYDAVGRLECTAVRMNPSVSGTLPGSACVLGTTGNYGPDRITKTVYDDAGQALMIMKAYGQTAANGLPPLQQAYVTYTYSPNGKRTSVKDANGNLATLTYDGFDRQAGWYFPSKTSVGASSADDYEAYGYDANGNRTSLRRRDGRVLTFTYDALDRMTSKLVPDGCAPNQPTGCPAAAATRDVYYGYDLQGHQTYARFDGAVGRGGDQRL